jgi:hypothetical protein
MKQATFKRIQEVASTLQLPAAVEHRAQMLFTKYRNSREQVQKLNVVEAACMVAATRELNLLGSDALAQKAIEAQANQKVSGPRPKRKRKRDDKPAARSNEEMRRRTCATKRKLTAIEAEANQKVSGPGPKRKRKRKRDDKPAARSYEELHPFACNTCTERFNQKKGLRVHKFRCGKKRGCGCLQLLLRQREGRQRGVWKWELSDGGGGGVSDLW